MSEQNKPTKETIAAELSKEAQSSANAEPLSSPEPKAAEPMAFDVSKLSPDALSALKAALENAPSAVTKKAVQNHFVQMREFEGNIVVDYGKAFQKVVKDLDTQSDKFRNFILFRLAGETKEREMLYTEFMSLPRVKCKILNIEQQQHEKSVGETYSKDLKRMVPLMVNWNEDSYTIQLPNGATTKVSALKVNA